MTVVETVLVFAGIPLGAFALIALVVLGPGAVRAPRYRPGGPWEYKPVWYLPHPDFAATTPDSPAALLDGSAAAEPAKASGGASGEW